MSFCIQLLLVNDSLVEGLLVIRVNHALEFGYSLTPLLAGLLLSLLSVVEGSQLSLLVRAHLFLNDHTVVVGLVALVLLVTFKCLKINSEQTLIKKLKPIKLRTEKRLLLIYPVLFSDHPQFYLNEWPPASPTLFADVESFAAL